MGAILWVRTVVPTMSLVLRTISRQLREGVPDLRRAGPGDARFLTDRIRGVLRIPYFGGARGAAQFGQNFDPAGARA